MDLKLVWDEKLLLNVMILMKKKMQSELLSFIIERSNNPVACKIFSIQPRRHTSDRSFFLPQVSLQPFITLLAIGWVFVKTFQTGSCQSGLQPSRRTKAAQMHSGISIWKCAWRDCLYHKNMSSLMLQFLSRGTPEAHLLISYKLIRLK